MSDFHKERTLVIIKPDGVQRSLIGDVIHRFERIGHKLVAMKLAVPTPEQVEEHYTLNPDWKKVVGEKSIESYKRKGQKPPSEDPLVIGDAVIDRLKSYMTSGPAIVMAWQGAHAVEAVRKVVGGTEPRSSDVGTIRGDYVLDSYSMADGDDRAIRNLIHASGTTDEAKQELAHWFEDKEIIDYRLVQEGILYDVNLDGILE